MAKKFRVFVFSTRQWSRFRKTGRVELTEEQRNKSWTDVGQAEKHDFKGQVVIDQGTGRSYISGCFCSACKRFNMEKTQF